MPLDLIGTFLLGSFTTIIGGTIVYKFLTKNQNGSRINENPRQRLNLQDGTTLYKTQDLITHVRKLQHDGKGDKLFLDWYPRNNYVMEVLLVNSGAKVIYRRIEEICSKFHYSSTLFRDHLEIDGLRQDCYLELTPEQQQYIGLTPKIENTTPSETESAKLDTTTIKSDGSNTSSTTPSE